MLSVLCRQDLHTRRKSILSTPARGLHCSSCLYFTSILLYFSRLRLCDIYELLKQIYWEMETEKEKTYKQIHHAADSSETWTEGMRFNIYADVQFRLNKMKDPLCAGTNSSFKSLGHLSPISENGISACPPADTNVQTKYVPSPSFCHRTYTSGQAVNVNSEFSSS